MKLINRIKSIVDLIVDKYGLAVIVLLAEFILLGAMLIELILDVRPCFLCLWQRIFWLIFVVFAVVFKKRYIIALPLIAGIGVSIYQFMLNLGFVTQICKIGFDEYGNIVELGSCLEADITILFFKLSEYNLMASIGALIYVIYVIRRKNVIKNN